MILWRFLCGNIREARNATLGPRDFLKKTSKTFEMRVVRLRIKQVLRLDSNALRFLHSCFHFEP